jgi:hypothetical protein
MRWGSKLTEKVQEIGYRYRVGNVDTNALIPTVAHIELGGTSMNSVFKVLSSPKQIPLVGGKSHTMLQEYSGRTIQFGQIDCGGLAIHRNLTELMLLDGMNVRLLALFGQYREACHHFLSLLNGLFTAKSW